MHQQDVPPNLSNKLIAPLATGISVAFADSLRYFPTHKTLYLGNPLRQAILDVCQITPEQARVNLGLWPDLPVVLVTGGSQGARHLNQVVCRALPELLKFCQVLQISGSKLYDETRELATSMCTDLDEQHRQFYKLVPYMSDEMPQALRAASLVLCRSGASTLCELAALGLPSILVPLPPAIGGSPQEANAATFGQKQAAIVIHSADLEPGLLVERVRSIIEQPGSAQAMQEAVRSFARLDATQVIVDTIVRIGHKTINTIPEREVLSI
jgi:UDP-N-acetylglucosamine--N-acetylmuramyl-(pentapeptide) pyrophosphoryl-undecaprenol N-acetylglucosamine transferase